MSNSECENCKALEEKIRDLDSQLMESMKKRIRMTQDRGAFLGELEEQVAMLKEAMGDSGNG